MERRLLHLAKDAVLLTALGGWLVFTIWIVVQALDAGIFEPTKGVVGAGFLIFFTPVAIGVALDELVIQRLRNGPPAPGRHKRFVLPDTPVGGTVPDQSACIDHREPRDGRPARNAS